MGRLVAAIKLLCGQSGDEFVEAQNFSLAAQSEVEPEVNVRKNLDSDRKDEAIHICPHIYMDAGGDIAHSIDFCHRRITRCANEKLSKIDATLLACYCTISVER